MRQFEPPVAAPGLVLPTAVDGKLDEALSRRLVAICAPAGYGKTHVMAALWRLARQRGWQALWLSPGNAAAALQQEPQPRTILFIDDLHLMRDPAVHSAIAAWLENAPPQAVLALASRGVLPLRLSRLRLMQQVFELDAEDLSLSLEETAALLAASGVALVPEQVGRLHAASEGWPVGLQLACSALAGGAEPGGLLQDFAGDRDVAAWFAEQVLPEIPPALADLVGRASLFERFSVEFCRDVLQVADAADLLAEATARGLFLMPLDRRGQWYRFHPLFTGFLRQQRLRLDSAGSLALYGAASCWCERQGMIGDAISHALAAADMPLALDLIRRHAGPALGLTDGVAELACWMRSLPRGRIGDSLALRAAHTWSVLLEGRLEEAAAALPALEAAVAGAAAAEPQAIVRMAELLRFALLTLSDRVGAGAQASTGWLGRWERAASPMEAGTALLAAGHLARMGETPWQACAQLEDAALHFQRAGAGTGMAIAAAIEAVTCLELGESARGAARLAAVREQMPARPHGPGAAALALAEAHYCYEENRLGEARRLLDALPPLPAGEAMLQAALLRTRLAQANGRHDEGQQVLCKAVQTAERTGQRRAVLLLQAERIVLLLRVGDTGSAQRLAPAAGLAADGVTVSAGALAASDVLALRICAMRLLSARGQHMRAQLLLRDLLKDARTQGRRRWVVQLLCARALLLARHGERNEAMRLVLEALAAGAAGGLCRTLADEGPALAELIADLAGRGAADIPQAWLVQLLDAWGRPAPAVAEPLALAAPAPDARAIVLDNALSPREVQVLRLVESGMRNSEMAAQLFLSEMTVKWHLRNIYGKLSVRNRTGALARAREMRLI